MTKSWWFATPGLKASGFLIHCAALPGQRRSCDGRRRLYQHSHRLVATAVGMSTIVLAVCFAAKVARASASSRFLALDRGTVIGALQGFVHARAQIASFVVTLAGLALWSKSAVSDRAQDRGRALALPRTLLVRI